MLDSLRKIRPFLFVLLLIATARAGWIFYSRWASAKEAGARRIQDEAANARKSVDLVGGTDFKILNFYPNPGLIKTGETGKLCYGVMSAKSVKLDPPVERLHPSLARCFEVSPEKTTTYTLTATDTAGRSISQTATIEVD